MIEVELPDGSIAEFPDDTPQEVMKSAIQKRFPAPPPSAPDQPWYMQAAQAADDVARLVASGATFGYADKLAGYMGGTSEEAERARTQEARDRAGSAGIVSEIGGAVATPVGMAQRGFTLLQPGVQAMKGLTGLGTRAGLAGLEGTVYGALTAEGNNQDVETGALIGALGGGAGSVAGDALSSGIQKVAGVLNKKPVIPTEDEIAARAAAAYQQADADGGMFDPASYKGALDDIRTMLAEDAYLPGNQPGVKTALDELERLEATGLPITFKGMEATRRKVAGGFDPMNKDNNRMLYNVLDKLDDYSQQGGSGAYPEARQLYAQKSKMADVRKAAEEGARRAKITGSGGNIDNATRQRMDKIAQKGRGYTADERAALENAAYGTPGRNLARRIGRGAPSTGAMGMVTHALLNAAGLGTGGMALPATLALTGVTEGAKRLGERGTEKAVQEVIDIIAAGGSRAAITPAKNAVQRLAESKREAIARVLSAIGAYQAAPAR